MNNLEEITMNLGALYEPKSALVIYKSVGNDKDMYVEHFDLDRNGNLINAHPLTIREAQVLAKALNTQKEKDKIFLSSKGILPNNVLYINPSDTGEMIWHTKAMVKDLYFTDRLDISNGKANVPPLLWFADRQRLRLFALVTQSRPKGNTPLYNAPFFNINERGNVCMGTVDINIQKSASLEEFIKAWENYFFNSYFSHLLGHNPIKGNCVNLWKRLVKTSEAFPKEVLKKSNRTLNDLLL